MSDGLLRISEAAALEAEGANILTIRRSKTDQETEGAMQYIGGPTVARVRAWLSAAGASVVEMQTAGRWQSPPCPAGYARGQLAARGAVAKLRCRQTRHQDLLGYHLLLLILGVLRIHPLRSSENGPDLRAVGLC